MTYFYLLINFFTIIVPLLFSFHPKLNFYKNWKPFFTANLSVALLFIFWDTWFTSMGVWGFNPAYVCGLYLGNLPIEEVLFFICIPYACVFTYHCLNLFFTIKWPLAFENIFTATLSAGLILTGLLFINRWYTSVTFISLGMVLLALKYGLKVRSLPRLFSIYALLLIPFFIVNGLLTGAWNNQVVVWYNNQENIGIRMLTIPFEDIFYGFEMIVLNVVIYEWLMRKRLAH
ncbi:MAG: lycopene cyclase domain-containing protein [Bacteroidota bacterium]